MDDKTIKKYARSIIAKEKRELYKNVTGIELTDAFIAALYAECEAYISLGNSIGEKTIQCSIEEWINGRIDEVAERWHESELLFELKKNGYIEIDGKKVRLDPALVAEYQHRKCVFLPLNKDTYRFFSGIVESSISDTHEKRTETVSAEEISSLITRYFEAELLWYRKDEEELRCV